MCYFDASCHDVPSLLAAIRTISPYVANGGAVWNGTYLDATDTLHAILLKYFPKDGPASVELQPAFIAELENIFQKHGVPWSDTPLLPIEPDEASIKGKAKLRYWGPPPAGPAN